VIQSARENGGYTETMDQGAARFMGAVDRRHAGAIAVSLGLFAEDIDTGLPLEVASTGLPYLLVPLKEGIGRAKISMDGFGDFLASFGAKFVYAFDPKTLECRTWDNESRVEDVATGSAAGPLCAYLVRCGVKKDGELIRLRQGGFAGRPSLIEGWVDKGEVFIRGRVAFFAAGECAVS
jgi:trans-2,3-dihydro-3-hydroxyanthranilate isomerase